MDIEKLNRAYILSLPAGREMNALIAEHVLGWAGKKTVYRWSDRAKKNYPMFIFAEGESGIGDYDTFVDEEGVKIQYGKPHRVHFPKEYSSDISAAWEVVEKIQKTKFVRVQCDNGDYWCKIGGEVLGKKGQGDTAPLAICRAALLAVIES